MKIIKNLIALLIVGGVCILLLRVFWPLPFNEELYNKVIDRLNRGELVEDQYGIVILPPDLKKASAGGEIIVVRPSTDQMYVVFKTWIGRGHDMKGYLYTSKPLAKNQTDYISTGGMTIRLNQHLHYDLLRQLSLMWYAIGFGMD